MFLFAINVLFISYFIKAICAKIRRYGRKEDKYENHGDFKQSSTNTSNWNHLVVNLLYKKIPQNAFGIKVKNEF